MFGSSLAPRLREWLTGRPPPRDRPFPDLTDRERDILDLLASGMTNATIGNRLHLSTKTVANNVSMILNKLHLVNRSEAIVRARDEGLGHRDEH